MEALVSHSLIEEVQETGRVLLLTVAIKHQICTADMGKSL